MTRPKTTRPRARRSRSPARPVGWWRVAHLLCWLSVILGLVLPSPSLSAAGKLESDQARVTITVTTFDGVPIPGARVRLTGVGFDETHEGTTGDDGAYVLVLPQGKTYDVTCYVGSTPFRFGNKKIPVAGAPLAFTLKLSVQVTFVPSPAGPVAVESPDAHVVITVINSLEQPEPDALVTLIEEGGGKRYTFQTDSSGRYALDLPKGGRYETTCEKYGVTFDMGTQEIPSVDTFHLTLKVILKSAAFLEDRGAEEAARTAIVAVVLTDERGNPESGATITVKAVASQKSWRGVSDSAGRFVFNLPREATYALIVEKNGVTFDAGSQAVGDLDKMEIALEVSLTTEYVETYRLENVFFDFDKATLRPESRAGLDELVAMMKKHPTMVIELAGHTDDHGDNAYNLKLSRARANAVRDYLVSRGIPLTRVSAKGYGELEPVASNGTPEGRQLNRRTEVRVITR